MKMRIRIETKFGEIYFGDPYEVDLKNVNYLWLNKRKCTMQEVDEVLRALTKHRIQLEDMKDWVALRMEFPIGCHLNNGVRVIGDFKIDSISLVSNPVDEYCKLTTVKESED